MIEYDPSALHAPRPALRVMSNKFPGRCGFLRGRQIGGCRAPVAEGSGWTTGSAGAWVTYCPACLPDEAKDVLAEAEAKRDKLPSVSTGKTALRVSIFEGERIRVEPVSFLGDAFDRYKDSCSRAGARYDFERRANLADRPALLEIVRALRADGWEVVLDPDLHAALTVDATRADELSAAADARLTVIRERLAARGRKLWGFQEAGVAFLLERPRGALLADQPGLGKTPQALLALRDDARVLVIAPKNVYGNWQNECRAWRPDLRVTGLHGDKIRWPEPGELCVATYEQLLISVPKTPAPAGTTVIVDEAHRLKGRATSTKRREFYEELRDRLYLSENTGVWALTGTPLVNELSEFGQVLDVANLVKNELGGDRRKFKKLALGDEAKYARELRRVMLRRKKCDVLKDLPPIVYQDLEVEISPAVRAELDEALARIVSNAVDKKTKEWREAELAAGHPPSELETESFREGAAGDVEGAIELAFDGRLPIPFELISRVKSVLALAKVPASLDVLRDLAGDEGPTAEYPVGVPGELWAGGKTHDSPLALATAHLAPVDMVLEALPGWTSITGRDGDPEKRTARVAEFQAGRFPGVALTIRAAGEGITLTRCQKLVENDFEWTPKDMEQIEGRFQRIGAQGTAVDGEERASILVVRMVAAHVLDRRILELLDIKRGIAQKHVEVATVGADHRASRRADEIKAALEGVRTSDQLPPSLLDNRRRGPESPLETIAAGVLSSYAFETGTFGDSIASQWRRSSQLSGKQWGPAVKLAFEARPELDPQRRPAKSAREEWAARALVTLAGLDGDRARELNDQGFNKIDGEKGHAYARVVASGLSERGWADAIRLATKYQRQVGEPPAEGTGA